MLTGDKGDTAHHIAFSCGLYSYDEDFRVFKIDNQNTADAIIDQIMQLNHEIQYGVTISGNNLIGILAAEDGLVKGESGMKMLQIIQKSKAIVVYRCSSGQKAQITQIVKINMRGSITLALGDGSNDVNMIQQAHIGVGIYGKEGNQAACFADYAVP